MKYCRVYKTTTTSQVLRFYNRPLIDEHFFFLFSASGYDEKPMERYEAISDARHSGSPLYYQTQFRYKELSASGPYCVPIYMALSTRVFFFFFSYHV